jgi:predicted transcriptional regulator
LATQRTKSVFVVDLIAHGCGFDKTTIGNGIETLKAKGYIREHSGQPRGSFEVTEKGKEAGKLLNDSINAKQPREEEQFSRRWRSRRLRCFGVSFVSRLTTPGPASSRPRRDRRSV